jgi:hypothetical protein
MTDLAALTTPRPDLERLATAFERLRAMEYLVADRGCCPSCNWRELKEQHPDRAGRGPALDLNDQSLDAAFGPPALSPEYQARLDALDDEDDEGPDQIFEEAEHAGALVRDPVLSNPLWICRAGNSDEIDRAGLARLVMSSYLARELPSLRVRWPGFPRKRFDFVSVKADLCDIFGDAKDYAAATSSLLDTITGYAAMLETIPEGPMERTASCVLQAARGRGVDQAQGPGQEPPGDLRARGGRRRYAPERPTGDGLRPRPGRRADLVCLLRPQRLDAIG